MIFDIRPLLTYQFWFTFFPPPLTPLAAKLLPAVFLLFLIAALVIRVAHKKTERFRAKTLRRLTRLLNLSGLLGLLFYFFAAERVFLLNMRFWYLLLAVGFLIWLFFILREALLIIPKEKSEHEKKELIRQYLPRGTRRA